MAWQGRTAVVTGIARPAGIGQACAKLLFKQGYNIIGIDNKPPSFNDDVPWPMNTSPSTPAAVDGLQTQSPAPATTAQKIAWLTCDLSQQEHILSLDSQIAGLGAKSIDILVNNAGIADPYMQSDDLHQRALLWSNYIAVNLSAPFLLSELLVPLMPHGTSSIIHISSTRALQSEPHCEGYAAAKAGLLGLTHAQAASLAPKRIRVNAVCAGWIDTSGETAEASSITQEQHEWHWTGKVGTSADIAELVGFLADSSKSGFITGQQFVIDGGVSKRMVYPE